MKKLSPKQERFRQEYLIDLNATQAAIRAGYSKKTARSIGQRLLTNVDIQKEIQKFMKKREKRTQITQDRVLEELYYLGFSNIQDYIKASTDGFIVFKCMDEIPEEKARAIEAIKVCVKEGKIEFKLHSKTKTIEMIGRHLGMFTDNLNVRGTIKHLLSMADLKKSLEGFEENAD